jgi:hypothetical protein
VVAGISGADSVEPSGLSAAGHRVRRRDSAAHGSVGLLVLLCFLRFVFADAFCKWPLCQWVIPVPLRVDLSVAPRADSAQLMLSELECSPRIS